MTFDERMRAAAKAANKAVREARKKYAAGEVTDEDDLTGVLVGRLDAAFDSQIAGIKWSSRILRHRKGTAAEEKKFGADLLLHVSCNSDGVRYSKGVLIQAKRVEADALMKASEFSDMKSQCTKMLNFTPAAFVMNYSTAEVRCASASRLANSQDRGLHGQCSWTSYRFFLELFRCPIGDPRITSTSLSQLSPKTELYLSGTKAEKARKSTG